MKLLQIKSPRYQKGNTSLAGMMIGITITLISLAAIISVYVTHKSNYDKVTQGVMLVQHNSQELTTYLNENISLSGFRGPDADGQYAPRSEIFTTGYLDGSNNTGVNNSDTLTYRIRGINENDVHDCLGNTIADGVISTNTLSINASNQLLCNDTVIMDGVETLHILYGEDLTSDGSANRYVNRNFLGLDLSRVVSIRIGLALIGETNTRNTAASQSLTILDETHTTADSSLRTPFETTLILRNVLP